MNEAYILSIDLGTTGNRVYCFNSSGKAVSSEYREFKQHFPKPGWVEHDAVEIWDSVASLIPTALKKGCIAPELVRSIGITNQRETTVIWNRETGIPVHNAIVWQCRRTVDICETLKKKGFETRFRETTGLVIDAYFSGTKIKWILDNVPGIKLLAMQGKILFGTIDTWILWKLTGGLSHKTDYTNASRTLIFDIRKKEWSKELLEILDIPPAILPEVQNSASDFGRTLNAPGLPDGIMVGGIAGDQQAAMAGQNCVNRGTSKNTYGTGCFLLFNNGDDFTISSNGLLTTLACNNTGKPVYALEGSVFIGGALIQWLRDYMKFFVDSAESEKMAFSATDSKDNVVVVPAFVGLGAPYWKPDVRGAIFGLTRDTTREQIVRASLKAIAFQSKDLIDAMIQDTQTPLMKLRVDGGAVKNSFLMQFQSDILGIPVLVPENVESTALGAAYLAGVSAGLFSGIDEIASFNSIAKEYSPRMENTEKERQLNNWKNSIKRLL